MKYQRIERKIECRSRVNQWLSLMLAILAGFTSSFLNAQQIEFIDGTHQSWSGGICCRHGSNYQLTFKVFKGLKNISLDTLWTDSYCHPLNQNFDMRMMKKDSTIQVAKSIVMDDHLNNYISDDKHACYDPSRFGTYIIYRVGGIRFELNIGDRIRHLVPLAYP